MKTADASQAVVRCKHCGDADLEHQDDHAGYCCDCFDLSLGMPLAQLNAKRAVKGRPPLWAMKTVRKRGPDGKGSYISRVPQPRPDENASAPRAANANDKAAVQRWLRGQETAAERGRQAAAQRGPDPRQAVAEALAAVNALAAMGLWPGPRDPASEAAVTEVRRRWARIQKRAMRGRQG